MDRPVLKPKLQTIDWLLEIIAALAVIIIISLALVIHQRYLSGSVLRLKHGEKRFNSALVLVCMSAFLYLGLTLLAQIPHTFKYPVPVTAENAESQYGSGLRILRTVKLFGLLMLLGLVAAHL